MYAADQGGTQHRSLGDLGCFSVPNRFPLLVDPIGPVEGIVFAFLIIRGQAQEVVSKWIELVAHAVEIQDHSKVIDTIERNITTGRGRNDDVKASDGFVIVELDTFHPDCWIVGSGNLEFAVEPDAELLNIEIRGARFDTSERIPEVELSTIRHVARLHREIRVVIENPVDAGDHKVAQQIAKHGRFHGGIVVSNAGGGPGQSDHVRSAFLAEAA